MAPERPTAGAGPAIRHLSRLRCPECGHERDEVMPTDACWFFYACVGCDALLRPLPGHCCVFCSYGSVSCPPRQLEDGGGCGC